MKTTSIFRSLLTTTIVVFACGVAQAQCESCDIGCENGVSGGACEGRCQYCVDGECVPNRTTYGYYQTNWRRWPVAAPAVPERPKRRRQRGPAVQPGEVDLPSPMDEGSARPDFPRTRKTGNGGGGTNIIDESFSMPMNEMPQMMAPESMDVEAMPNVEAPQDDTGPSLFDGARRGAIGRNTIRQATALTKPIPATSHADNPLRALGFQSAQTSGSIPASLKSPVRTAPRRLRAAANPQPLTPSVPSNVRDSNPLR